MPDFHKMALVLSVLWIAAATTMTLATAQEATFSEGGATKTPLGGKRGFLREARMG